MKMNKFLMATAAVAVFTGSVLTYTVARAATDSLVTEAVIVEAMTVDCSIQDLNFGDIGASALGGTVDMDTAGSPTHTGVTDLGGTQTEGTCAVTGDAARAYDITFVANDLTGPGANMTLTSLVADNANLDGPFAGLGPHSATLAAGVDTISIGATLNVGAAQVAGTYNGTIDVTVDYQ